LRNIQRTDLAKTIIVVAKSNRIRLLDCWIIGLLDFSIVGFLDCWDFWIVGIFGFLDFIF
jgi:hypothetical protein